MKSEAIRVVLLAGFGALAFMGTVASTVLAAATQVSAHRRAPPIPTALVEDVQSATADIEFMDYVGNGRVIKLAPHDVLVLSYLKSCEHETIAGGTVGCGHGAQRCPQAAKLSGSISPVMVARCD